MTDDFRDRLARADAAEAVNAAVADQAERWRRGERVLVETYLPLHPTFASSDARLDLIYAEYLLRESLGEQPSPAEYAFRFPDLAERIGAILDLYGGLLRPPPEPEVAPEPEPPSAVRIPGYEVGQELGRGGMSVVYRARHRGLGRTVALKVLRPELGFGDTEARLQREAEAMARLPHPNIVQIYEVGTHAGQPFLALEYVAGGTLADRLRTGVPTPRETASLLRTVATAVHAAHQQGIVHRDLKPGNVLLSADFADGADFKTEDRLIHLHLSSILKSAPSAKSADQLCPKVADFGLARCLDHSRMSRTGEVIGTPSYMAPEQARGEPDIGPAADVYALGAVLYECLTGLPPFRGDSPLAVLAQVAAAEPVPPSRLRAGVPADLEAVCLKCLEKDSRLRYGSAAALADDLGRFLAGEPTYARPLTVVGRSVKLVRRHPVSSSLAAAVVVALAIGAAGVLWQWRAAVAARGALQVSLAAEADQRRHAEQNLYYGRIAQVMRAWESSEATLARELLAACRPEPGRDDWRGWEWHYLRRQLASEAQVVNCPEPVVSMAGRGDEIVVALSRPARSVSALPTGPGAVGLLRLTDNSLQSICDQASSVTAVATSGSLVAWSTADHALTVMDRTTGRILYAAELDSFAYSLAIASDGSLLYAMLVGGNVVTVNLMTGAIGAARQHLDGRTLAVSPDGSQVAVGSWASGRLLVLDAATLEPIGEPQQMAGGIAALAYTPGGAKFAAAGGSGEVVLWDTNSQREIRRFQGHAGAVYAMTFSPDGKKLATAGADRTVRLWGVETGLAERVYRGHTGVVVGLAFGPSGAWLASGGHDRTVRIWDTTQDSRGRLLRVGGIGRTAALTFDGDAVRVATADATSGWSVADGRPLGRRPPRGTLAPVSSRPVAIVGGRRIVAVARDDPRMLTVTDAETGRLLATRPGSIGPITLLRTDPTSRWIAWASSDPAGGLRVRRWDTAAETEAAPLHFAEAGAIRGLAVSPNGSLVAVCDGAAVWLAGDAGPPRELLRADGLPGPMAFAPDGRGLAVVADEALHVFDADAGELRYTVTCPPGVTAVAYHPSGTRLAAVDSEGAITLVDPLTGKVAFQLASLTRPRQANIMADGRVAFSADGTWLAATNWDGTVSLWDGRPTAK